MDDILFVELHMSFKTFHTGQAQMAGFTAEFSDLMTYPREISAPPDEENSILFLDNASSHNETKVNSELVKI